MKANDDRVFWIYFYDGDGGKQTWSTEATLIEALASAMDWVSETIPGPPLLQGAS